MSKLTFEDLKKADEVLDTLVFGKPLGLFGEKIFNGDAESLENDLKKYLQDKGVIEKPTIVGRKVRFYEDVTAYSYTTGKFCVHIPNGTIMEVISDPFESVYDYTCYIKVKSPNTGCEYKVPYRESYLLPKGY